MSVRAAVPRLNRLRSPRSFLAEIEDQPDCFGLNQASARVGTTATRNQVPVGGRSSE